MCICPAEERLVKSFRPILVPDTERDLSLSKTIEHCDLYVHVNNETWLRMTILKTYHKKLFQ